MGQNAQLNLAIVKTDQNLSRLGNKGFANAPAIFGAYGDVLQVGIGRGQAAGIGTRNHV